MEISREEYLSRLSKEFGDDWKNILREGFLLPLDEVWESVHGEPICIWKALWAHLSLEGKNWRHGVSRYGVITDAGEGTRWASTILDIMLGDGQGSEEIYRDIEKAVPHAFGGQTLEEYLDTLRVNKSKGKGDRIVIEYHTYVAQVPRTPDTIYRYGAAVRFVYDELRKRAMKEKVKQRTSHTFDELGPTTALIAPVKGVTSDVRTSIISEGITASDFDKARLILHRLGILTYSGDKSARDTRYLLVIDADINLLPLPPSKEDRKMLQEEIKESVKRERIRNKEKAEADLQACLMRRDELLQKRRSIDQELQEVEEEIVKLRRKNIELKLEENKKERELLEEELDKLS